MSEYSRTIEFLYAHLPMYQRVGPVAFKKGLGNTRALLSVLGNPHQNFPCIHIAGTNGKGTVSHMLAACLTAAGLRTGLYVSPHYRDFRERIKIDGRMITRRTVTEIISLLRPEVNRLEPSFFEMTVALAFRAFADNAVDIAVIETGLGGRLDSTNVISPLLSVITNISYDHMSMLGNTLPKIAREKAGIIKQRTPVVIGEYQREVAHVFKSVAHRRHAPISFADKPLRVALRSETLTHQVYDVILRDGTARFSNLNVGCAGPFQSANLTTALRALEVLAQEYPQYAPDDRAIRTGLRDIRTLSGYKGRWQVLSQRPLVLCDSAHNAGGLSIVLDRIRQMQHPQQHFVIGFVNDKDLDTILPLFPQHAQYYFCRPDIPRGLDAHALRAVAELYGLNGKAYNSVRGALNAAKRKAGMRDLVFVGGSTFVVAEVV